ncbi:hypothetical protein SMICM17S_01401 [Streptomyces microflavus]
MDRTDDAAKNTEGVVAIPGAPDFLASLRGLPLLGRAWPCPPRGCSRRARAAGRPDHRRVVSASKPNPEGFLDIAPATASPSRLRRRHRGRARRRDAGRRGRAARRSPVVVEDLTRVEAARTAPCASASADPTRRGGRPLPYGLRRAAPRVSIPGCGMCRAVGPGRSADPALPLADSRRPRPGGSRWSRPCVMLRVDDLRSLGRRRVGPRRAWGVDGRRGRAQDPPPAGTGGRSADGRRGRRGRALALADGDADADGEADAVGRRRGGRRARFRARRRTRWSTGPARSPGPSSGSAAGCRTRTVRSRRRADHDHDRCPGGTRQDALAPPWRPCPCQPRVGLGEGCGGGGLEQAQVVRAGRSPRGPGSRLAGVAAVSPSGVSTPEAARVPPGPGPTPGPGPVPAGSASRAASSWRPGRARASRVTGAPRRPKRRGRPWAPTVPSSSTYGRMRSGTDSAAAAWAVRASRRASDALVPQDSVLCPWHAALRAQGPAGCPRRLLVLFHAFVPPLADSPSLSRDYADLLHTSARAQCRED